MLIEYVAKRSNVLEEFTILILFCVSGLVPRSEAEPWCSQAARKIRLELPAKIRDTPLKLELIAIAQEF